MFHQTDHGITAATCYVRLHNIGSPMSPVHTIGLPLVPLGKAFVSLCWFLSPMALTNAFRNSSCGIWCSFCCVWKYAIGNTRFDNHNVYTMKKKNSLPTNQMRVSVELFSPANSNPNRYLVRKLFEIFFHCICPNFKPIIDLFRRLHIRLHHFALIFWRKKIVKWACQRAPLASSHLHAWFTPSVFLRHCSVMYFLASRCCNIESPPR